MKNLYFIFLLLLLSIGRLFSQTLHPIDSIYEKCREDNGYGDYVDQLCAGEVMTDWDKQLNKVYKELRSILPEEGKVKLRDSQLKWLKYRDAEFDFIENMFQDDDGAEFPRFSGSMYPRMIVFFKLHILKERVLELETYLRVLKEG